MAVQSYPYLVISDGTTTVTIATGAAPSASDTYGLVRDTWAPSVAVLRSDALGGRASYSDVIEEILINVRGATAAAATNNLQTLNRLLDQAERFARGESVTRVYVGYVPQGSTVASSSGSVYQAMVLGRPGGEQAIALPAAFNRVGNIFEIDNVRLRFVRRGGWIIAGDGSTVSSAVSNPGIMSTPFSTSHPIVSPMLLDVRGFRTSTTATISNGFLLVAGTSAKMATISPDAMTATGYTAVADVAASALNSTVLRYTATGTTAATSGTATFTIAGAGYQVGVFASVRPNNAATAWRVKVKAKVYGNEFTTPETLINGTDGTVPRWAFLGILSSPLGFGITAAIAGTLNLVMTASATASSPTLDVDHIAMIDLDNETSSVIAHGSMDISQFGAGGTGVLEIIHQPETYLDTRVWVTTTLTASPMLSYTGDAAITTSGGTVAAMWLATNGTFWRYVDSNGTVLQNQVIATRSRTYLTPE